MSLYDTLKAAKIGATPDVFTTLRAQVAPFAKGEETENLFDINNPNIFKGYYNSGNSVLSSYPINGFVYVSIEPNKKYSVSGGKRSTASAKLRWCTTASVPADSVAVIRTGQFEQNEKVSITANTNENYLSIFVCGDSDSNTYGGVENAVAVNCKDLIISKE